MLFRLFFVSLLISMIFTEATRDLNFIPGIDITAQVESTVAEDGLDANSNGRILIPDDCPSPIVSCNPGLTRAPIPWMNCMINCGTTQVAKCSFSVHKAIGEEGSAMEVSAKADTVKATVEIDCLSMSPYQNGQHPVHLNLPGDYKLQCELPTWTMSCTASGLGSGFTCKYGCWKKEPPFYDNAGTINFSVKPAGCGQCE